MLLFDEWIDVASPLALVLLDSRGQIVKQTSFQELARLLNVPGDQIVSVASFGPWMQGVPAVDTGIGAAKVKAAGKTLVIRLSDGRISIE